MKLHYIALPALAQAYIQSQLSTTFQSASVYSGQWPGYYYGQMLANGQQHGAGGYNSFDYQESFTGYYKYDKEDFGTWKDRDGSTYKGEYDSNGDSSGLGEWWNPQGDHYIGLFANDNFNGMGIFDMKTGDWPGVYSGTWKNGELEGMGTYVGTGSKAGVKYTGRWANGEWLDG